MGKYYLIDNFHQVMLEFDTLEDLKEYCKRKWGMKPKKSPLDEDVYYLDNAFFCM